MVFPDTPAPNRSHGSAVAFGGKLSTMQGSPLSPAQVARVLNAAKLNYAIIGAHAVNAYSGKPRATVDVDLVAMRPKAAAAALTEEFPQLTSQVTPVVIRLFANGAEAVDVIQPTSAPLFKRILSLKRTIKLGQTPAVIPIAEAVVALKFQSMVSLTRKMTDRVQDAVDLARIAIEVPELDLEMVKELGDVVFTGGGKELLKHMADARVGKRIEF